MATSYSSLLGFALPVQGELSGTWGDTINNSITQLVEDAVAGYATASVTSGDWTLTTTDGATNQARMAILIPTGTPGTTRNIVAPSQSKAYIVINESDGSIVVKGGATTGTTIATGVKALVAWDGSDFVTITSSAVDGVTSVAGTGTVNGITLTGTVTSSGNLTLGGALTGVNLASQVTGTLPVANGGTGATSLTANNVILGNGTSAVQVVAPGSSGNVLTSNGTTWASAAVPSQVYPGAGIAVSTGSAWGTSKTSPTGDIVGTSDTQTLTNKTISADNNTISGIAASSFVLSNGSGNIDGAAAQKAIPTGDVVGTSDTQTLTNKTLTAPAVSNPVFTGAIDEQVYNLTGTEIDPANGTIQYKTLASNTTFTEALSEGESVTLMIDDGTDYTVTWPTMTWVNNAGVAPILATTGYTVVALWKVSTTLYGALVGNGT